MKLNTIDGAALMSQPLRPPDFVVDSLLSQGLHILAGSPKVGKSWLVLWLAVLAAMEAAGVLCEHTSYPGVGHGVGLGEGLPCAGWLQRAVEFWRQAVL